MSILSLADFNNSTPQSLRVYTLANGSLPSDPRQNFFARNGVFFPLAADTSNNPQGSSTGVPYTAPTGSNLTYLSRVDFAGVPYGTGTGNQKLLTIVDILWAQSLTGSTTLQTINTGTIPARDINGAAVGNGVYMLLAKNAFNLTHAATTCTVSYTNSSGTSGRTAITRSFSNAAGGQTFFLQMDAGDVGVQSVETAIFSVAVSGINLVIFRPIAVIQIATSKTSNMDGDAITLALPRVYNNSCINFLYSGGGNYSGNIVLSQG